VIHDNHPALQFYWQKEPHQNQQGNPVSQPLPALQFYWQKEPHQNQQGNPVSQPLE
jgi:hypothetical protein